MRSRLNVIEDVKRLRDFELWLRDVTLVYATGALHLWINRRSRRNYVGVGENILLDQYSIEVPCTLDSVRHHFVSTSSNEVIIYNVFILNSPYHPLSFLYTSFLAFLVLIAPKASNKDNERTKPKSRPFQHPVRVSFFLIISTTVAESLSYLLSEQSL